MSDCCSTTKDGICSVSAGKPGFCPACGKKGRSVATLTVKSLVRDHTRVARSGSYSFCRTSDCDVVYFSDMATFRKPDLKVRVGIKETEDPAPLCYCFDYSRADIRREIETLGSTNIPNQIRAEIEAGFCACEVKNPSGTCCLGDITRAVQAAKSAGFARSREAAGAKPVRDLLPVSSTGRVNRCSAKKHADLNGRSPTTPQTGSQS